MQDFAGKVSVWAEEAWDYFWNVFAEPITLLSLLVILGLRLRSRGMALQPIRSAARQRRARRKALGHGWAGTQRRRGRDWLALRRLKRALKTNAKSQEPLAVAMVAADLCSRYQAKHDAAGTTAQPYRSPPMDSLLWICRQALEPSSENLLTRYFLRDEWLEHRAWLEKFVRYLDQFEGLREVKPKPYAKGGRILFSDAVTAMSGALVLTDATTSNSGTVEEVAVWHTGEWHGQTYEDRWGRWDASRRRRAAWLPPFHRRALFDPDGVVDSLGAYNGRVPTLLSAEIRQRPSSDGATLVLTIGETDYLSTEPPSTDGAHKGRSATDQGATDDRVPDDVPAGNGLTLAFREAASKSKASKRREPESPEKPEPAVRHCKKLFPSDQDPADPGIERQGLGARLLNPPGTGHHGGRGILLNGKICLVSRPEPDLQYLVLQNRSHAPSNGGDILGPTSGGVVELEVSHDPRDADEYGTLSVVAGIRRELREELGLSAGYDLGVAAVFLSNSRPYRNPATMARLDESKRLNTKDNGELVATLLAIGFTTLGPDEFADERVHGSPSKGLYESRGCLFLPMGSSAVEFAENLFHGRYEPETSAYLPPISRETGVGTAPGPAGVAAGSAREIGLYLDQATVVGALYAGARVFGVKDTVAACTEAMGRRPWWAQPWPDAEPGYASRVIRDPDALAGSDKGVPSVIDALFDQPKPWNDLLASLRKDAAEWMA